MALIFVAWLPAQLHLLVEVTDPCPNALRLRLVGLLLVTRHPR